MVTITGYSTREGVGGKQSLFLHVESDLIPKSSKTSGRTYFVTRKAKVLAAIDEELAQQLIGHTLPGNITKQEVDHFEVTDYHSGETKMLHHRNVYVSAAS
jgi:hypothetical protein